MASSFGPRGASSAGTHTHTHTHTPSDDPNAIYARARDTIGKLEYHLQQLESRRGDARLNEADARSALTSLCNALKNDVSALDRSVHDAAFMAANPARRDWWRKRASQLRAEGGSLRSSVTRFLDTTYAREQEERARRMLFNTGAAAVKVDALLSERASLTSSHAMVDEFTTLAENVAASLRSQRATLKNVHRKVIDVASALGLSTTLMRVIERRTTADKILVYGGMLVILLVLFLVYWLLLSK